ncbi:hypothetical protein [Escherichia coli]|uniref:hypothetical protein n=1 Tax=Escherichia coli TaxID=562 RepID=UPI001FD9BC6E|nr:hypothetical protein [Escherichia coli]
MANIVTAKIYGPAQKMRFLPYAFAEFYLQAENYVCNFMKKYAVGYDGGCWEYITYENARVRSSRRMATSSRFLTILMNLLALKKPGLSLRCMPTATFAA